MLSLLLLCLVSRSLALPPTVSPQANYDRVFYSIAYQGFVLPGYSSDSCCSGFYKYWLDRQEDGHGITIESVEAVKVSQNTAKFYCQSTGELPEEPLLPWHEPVDNTLKGPFFMECPETVSRVAIIKEDKQIGTSELPPAKAICSLADEFLDVIEAEVHSRGGQCIDLKFTDYDGKLYRYIYKLVDSDLRISARLV